jgi:hypothetical protein
MGDLNVERQGVNSRGARLRFEQGTVNSEYLMHLYSVFAPYCGTAPKVYTRPSGRPSISFKPFPLLSSLSSMISFILTGLKEYPLLLVISLQLVGLLIGQWTRL